MNRRILTRLVALLLAAMLLCGAVALADTNVTQIRTLDRGASLRSEPRVDSRNKIASIHAGVTLDVYDEINGWYYVCHRGMWGYVASTTSSGEALVTIVSTRSGGNSSSNGYNSNSYNSNSYSPTPGSSNVTQICTLSQGASLRSEPRLSADKIDSVHAGCTLDVYGEVDGWYYVCYRGLWGYVASTTSRGEPLVTVTATRSSYGNTGSASPYDMGVPNLHNNVYYRDQMNMVIFWVQTQLKATGIWYDGEQWDCTGRLGSETMSEIASFMRSMGYPHHTGVVDQNVVNELAAYLGADLVPVYVGGYYDGMRTIMIGDAAGSMSLIVSNLRDNVARTTEGARWVQYILSKLGYYNKSIDGKYGESTQAAVNAFQRDHGFQERDYVTLGVARAMLEQYCYRGYSIDLLP